VLGVVGGVAAYVLIHLIAIITNLALLGRWGTTLPSLAHYHDAPRLVVAGGDRRAARRRPRPVGAGHPRPGRGPTSPTTRAWYESPTR
jgi:hypothetical protein